MREMSELYEVDVLSWLVNVVVYFSVIGNGLPRRWNSDSDSTIPRYTRPQVAIKMLQMLWR